MKNSKKHNRILILYNSIKKRGFIPTIKLIISELMYDKNKKLDTSKLSELHSLNISGENLKYANAYMPTNKFVLDKIFNFLELNIDISQSIILDYGSGKGRVLIHASKFNFKRIIGVEFAKELYDIAKQNIAKLNLLNIEVYNEDALIYDIPDGTNIFYLFNPFTEELMDKVLLKIEQHKRNYKKKVLIVYVNPICKGLLLNNSRMEYKIVYSYEQEVIVFEI